MTEPNDGASLDLLTVADVCALFKVTKDWVYDEVEAGRLPNVKLGRKHLRFRRRELESYLDEHLRRPPPGPAADQPRKTPPPGGRAASD
jgi:excisionase family DNA binding protein